MRPRSMPGSRLQRPSRNAARAEATARSTSPAVAAAMLREQLAGGGVLDRQRAPSSAGTRCAVDDVARLAQEPIDAGHGAPHPSSDASDPTRAAQIVRL